MGCSQQGLGRSTCDQKLWTSFKNLAAYVNGNHSSWPINLILNLRLNHIIQPSKCESQKITMSKFMSDVPLWFYRMEQRFWFPNHPYGWHNIYLHATRMEFHGWRLFRIVFHWCTQNKSNCETQNNMGVKDYQNSGQEVVHRICPILQAAPNYYMNVKRYLCKKQGNRGKVS